MSQGEMELPELNRSEPLFGQGTGPNEILVVFVLGGPGAGKGTQCANLKQHYGFKHLSAGDLLREEQKRPGSAYGELINDIIREGNIVPKEITVKLLEAAINHTIEAEGKRRFLVDGFPRKIDQMELFETYLVSAKFTLFFDCPEDVMQKRLLKRGETSGRVDDNAESIKKRFATYLNDTMPVIKHFEGQQRLVAVSAAGTTDEVFDAVKKELSKQGIEPEA